LVNQDLVISASGIRGVVYRGLSPDLAGRLAAALATRLGKGRYVVGRDTRPSGEILSLAVSAGITATGSDVIDIGICPTPTIQLAVEKHQANGGLAITASHNPAQWNALKLISASGTFLSAHQVDQVVAAAREGSIAYSTHNRAGRIQADHTACEYHLAGVLGLDYVDVDRISQRGFKVALDCTNGAGSVIAPELLRRLGCQVMELDCRLSGVFRRNPEPVEQNLLELAGLVREKRADLGFALDPDADRLAVVNELGEPVGEEYTLVICADLVLSKTKGPLVTNLSTTMVLEEVARRHGVKLHRTPIGEINVVVGMKAVGSVIGGEGNGGVILPGLHYGRDAMVAMGLVLEALVESGQTVSGMMNKFPKYAILKEKVETDLEVDFADLRTRMENEFPDGGFNYEDGIRVELGGSWLHLRKSGTEPVIRLISEAPDMARAQKLVAKALRLLGK
jgi:phosphomannomutase